MDMNDVLKGGQLAHRPKLAMAVVAVVTVGGAYLVGDATLIDAAQRLAVMLLGS